MDIRRTGGRAHIYVVNVGDFKQVNLAADQVHSQVGDVHILVNNAAILHCKALADLTANDIVETMRSNLMSHFWTVQAFLPDMLSLGEGHIVAVSSNLGLVGKSHFCDYSATKHGINGFMESLSDELRQMGKGGLIKLTTVCPAVINTGLSRAVETRFPSLFPIMSTEYAARKIITAVLRNETFLVIPRGYRWLYACTRLVRNQELSSSNRVSFPTETFHVVYNSFCSTTLATLLKLIDSEHDLIC